MNATATLMALVNNAVNSATRIARYDSQLCAVYYPKSHKVYLYGLNGKRISRSKARNYLDTGVTYKG